MAEDIDRAKDLALSKAAKYISSCLTVSNFAELFCFLKFANNEN